jgi:general secretion pathway protein D
VGDKIPVITSTTSQNGFVSDSVNYLDVGLKLDVEPAIYSDDEVAIRVSMEVSSLGSAVKTSSGTLAYQIGTRNANTLLRLHDGETQLLAGLISRDERSSSSRIPGIGDLPVLGRLFSTQRDNGQRTELVLAITPRILRNIRRPSANESEIWVGTELVPKLRPVGGLRALAEAAAPGEPGAAPAAPGGAPAPAPKPASAAASGPAALQWVGPAEAKLGDTIELKLVLNTPDALRGMPIEIAFSKERLQLVDVLEGDFFRQDGSATSFSKGGDVKDGRLNVGVLRNQTSGVNGQGSVVTLVFKPLAAGAGEVSVTSAQPIAIGAAATPPKLAPPWTVQIK